MEGTKAKIFNAAVSVFSEKGFHGATMDEIARKAQVAKGTLYYHFKSKEETFNFLAEEGMNVIKSEILKKTEGINNPVEKLRQIIVVQMDLIYKYNEFFKMILGQIWKDNTREEYFRKWIYEYIELIGDYVDEGVRLRILRDENKNFLATIIFGMISSVSLYRIMTNNLQSQEDITNMLLEYVLNGMKA